MQLMSIAPVSPMTATRTSRLTRLAPTALRRAARAGAVLLPLFLLLLSAGAEPARAQGSTTAGAIRGRVTGEQNEPLAGAVVTATNEETGYARSVQAGEDGVYLLRFLPVGSYRVAVRRIGSTPQERPGVRVTVGSTASANFALRATAVQLSQVQVTAQSQGIDVADKGVRTTVSQEEIENLPSLGRDFTDFINLSPLVSPTPEATTGGQFAIAGQRPSQTNIQIDGVDANNSFFGENRGGSRIPFNYSLETIREFQVITNGYDVEYGNYSGGIVNILTRSGTNKFEGSAFGNYRGDRLTSRDFDNRDPKDFSAQQYAIAASGPIKKDKLFYLFSLDGQRRREPFQPRSANLLRSAAQATLAGLPSRTDNQRAADSLNAARSIAFADSLDRFYNILQTKYGISDPASGYDRFLTSNDVLTLFGRIDWNLSERNRLSVRHNFSTYHNENEIFGDPNTGDVALGGLSKAENFRNRTNSFVSELTSSFSADRFNVLRLQYSDENRPRVANDKRPQLSVTSIGSLSPARALYGGASISFQNSLDERKFQLVDNFTFALGRDHSIKLGTNNIFSRFDNIFCCAGPSGVAVGTGSFTFPSLEALEKGQPTRYQRTLRLSGEPPRALFNAQEYSAYAQDDWQVTPKLLASVGLRYDIARYGDRPGRVIDVERAFGFRTGNAPIDDNNVSPRVALSYDLKGDASSVIRVGGGLFYGRVPFVLGSNVQITDVPLVQLDCAGSTADLAADRPPDVTGYSSLPESGTGNPTNCGGSAGIGGVPTYTFWSDGFEIPETWKANAGFEHQLFERTRLKLDFTFTASNKLYSVRNLNLRDAQFTLPGEGGRNIYVPATRFDPTGAAGADRLRFTDLGDIMVNYNDGIARSAAFSAEVRQRMSDKTSLMATYAYTRANDNNSYNCCTASEGYTGVRVGLYSPNVLGGIKDYGAAWGPSNFVRAHTFVMSGFTELPLKFRVSAFWRIQSGTPWGPEQGGDLNGDGASFNDRPFIFDPDSLPVFVASTVTGTARDSVVAFNRSLYRSYIDRYDCIKKYVGQIIPRNSCRQPTFNRLDLSVRRRFDIPTVKGARGVEFQVDLFNVLNGINRDWGRYTSVQTSNRNLLRPESFNASTGQIEYTAYQSATSAFGRETASGSNLLLQFSAQLGIRAYF